MLNKEICKKCINKGKWKWSSFDDNRWKYRELLCRKIGEVNVNDNPPNDCKYILEHIITNEALNDTT